MSFAEVLNKSKYRSNDQSLIDLWTALKSGHYLNLKPVPRAAILTTVLTMQRPTDVCGMTLDQINRRSSIWIIPGETHRRIVPLTDAAMEIINVCSQENPNSRGIVFPAPSDKSRSIDTSAVSRMFRKTKHKIGWDGQGIADIPVVTSFVLAGRGVDVSVISAIRGRRDRELTEEHWCNAHGETERQREALVKLQNMLLESD